MIIAISNQKGGVAKTTTCVSLGAALVDKGHEALVVDLDPQANLSLALGVNPDNLRRSMADVLLGNHTLASISRETSLPGLDLAPARHDNMQLVEKFLHVRQNYEQTLRHALSAVTHYNFVLCDCPPALGPITLNALAAADLLLIPTQCEYFSAHGLNDMLEAVAQIRQKVNPTLRYRIMVTMFDRRNRVHQEILEELQGAFGEAVLHTKIEIDTKLRESPIFGQPITHYAPNSRASAQYQALAGEILQYAEQKTAPSQSN